MRVDRRKSQIARHPALDFRVQKKKDSFSNFSSFNIVVFMPVAITHSAVGSEREKVFFMRCRATVYLIQGTTSRFMNVVNFCLPSKRKIMNTRNYFVYWRTVGYQPKRIAHK